MDLEVTVQLDGEDVPVGKFFARAKRGIETCSFKYDESFLSCPKAFPLAPDMPLTQGTLHANGMFPVFSDAMPDRWGRSLLLRAEAREARVDGRTARTLVESDYLSGVSDATRQGALRFWVDGKAVAPSSKGVPREVSIPQLLGESYLLEDDAMADVADLLSAGSSLGGARPKASIVDEHGNLLIAKFPRKTETLLEDTCAWEQVALILASGAGIPVPKTRLIRIDGKAVLLLSRFDRRGTSRIPYMSAMTAIQGADGGHYSYLDVVDFIERYGSKPAEDIPLLWDRIVFSCLIGNTDDHMRNHGFLWDGKGWRLAPAFDVNPTPGNGMKYLSSAIDFDDTAATVENALRAAEYYRLSDQKARKRAMEIRTALRKWQQVARQCGISAASVDRMRDCFESSVS